MVGLRAARPANRPLAQRLVFFFSALLCGCASGAVQSDREGSIDLDRLTRDDISTVSEGNAYELVQRLRPNWLARYGPPDLADPTGQGSQPVVFLGEVYYGPLNSLSEIEPNDIREMRFWSASDATTRFGTGYMAGIIQVLLRRSPEAA